VNEAPEDGITGAGYLADVSTSVDRIGSDRSMLARGSSSFFFFFSSSESLLKSAPSGRSSVFITLTFTLRFFLLLRGARYPILVLGSVEED